MDFSRIELDFQGDIAVLRLNRPEKLNAMDLVFFKELKEAAEAVDQNRDLRAVVISTTGPHFSAGLDLTAGVIEGPSQSSRSQAAANRSLYRAILNLQDSINRIASLKVPSVAAVKGYCLGGGLDLVAACDLRVASPDAVFSIRETRMAMVADLGSLQRLLPIVGLGRLKDLALTARDFGALEAYEMGLVNKLVEEKERVEEEAVSLARQIASLSPFAVQGTKAVIDRALKNWVEDNLEWVALWNSAFLKTHDLEEAFAAFMEKRAPNFRGE